MASPARLLEAVGEYVADRVVGPVPSMQTLSAATLPSAAAPVAAVKRQSMNQRSPSFSAIKKTAPVSKKVSPLRHVKSEPARELPKRASRPKAAGAGFYSEANQQTLA